jgi:uncharacterized protein YjbK
MSGNTGTEVELKLRVEDLAALMRVCTAAQGMPAFTAIQRNQYLDTAGGALDKGRYVLRLREERDATTTTTYLTAKGPAQRSPDGALSTVPEEEIVVDGADVDAIRKAPQNAFAILEGHSSSTPARRDLVAAMRAAVGADDVIFAGEFVNERTRVAVTFPEGFSGVLELDRVVFPGNQIHHEVEFEVPEGVNAELAHQAFLALFARAAVTGKSAPGKAKRFFAALRGEVLS